MKIEKISETQIKFLLTNEDLKERKIKVSELAQGSEKAQAFFRDIMTEAMLDCGFDASDTPLMIEAMPIAVDSVMIIVSKVGEDNDIDKKVSLVPQSLDKRKFKQQGIKIIENNSNFINESTSSKEDLDEENVYIYSFIKLDDIINLSERLYQVYKGKNVLYKYEDRYFLLLQNNNISFSSEVDHIISEYGQKHISTIISKYHLEEHAEPIIKENAIEVLSSL